MVTSLNEWVAAVKEHRKQFVTESDALETREYVFEQLRDKNLVIPPPKRTAENATERDEPFVIQIEQYNSPDIRVLGRALQTALAPFFERMPPSICTPNSFIDMIKEAIQGERLEHNADILSMMSVVEKTLLGLAAEKDSTFVSIETADKASFPLYIWYLVMNMPAEDTVEEVPILMATPIPAQEVPAATAE